MARIIPQFTSPDYGNKVPKKLLITTKDGKEYVLLPGAVTYWDDIEKKEKELDSDLWIDMIKSIHTVQVLEEDAKAL